MRAAFKIEVLQKALAGDALTSIEEDALRECVTDYRRRLKLGNGFKLRMEDILQAFEILFDDVQFMTAGRRQQTIGLLINAGARGYQVGNIPIPKEHPTDERRAEDFRAEVRPEEVIDTHLEMEREAS